MTAMFVHALAVVGLLGTSCTRPRHATTLGTPSLGNQQVCRQLGASGPIEERLAATMPLSLGGALYWFDGVQTGALPRALDPLGLQNVEVVECGVGEIVVFVPGVDARAAVQVEA